MSPGGENKSFRRFKRPRMPERLPARRLVWIGIAAVVLYLLVLSDFGILRRWELSREAAAIESGIEDLQARRRSLESRIGELDNDAALERIAREEYGMVREGEHVYRLSVPDSTRERRRKR